MARAKCYGLLPLVTPLAIARIANVHAVCYGCYGCYASNVPAGGKGFVRLNAKQPALRYLSRLLLKLSLAAFRSIGTAWDGLGRQLGRQNAQKRQCLCGLGRWDGSHRGTCLCQGWKQKNQSLVTSA